MSAPPRVPDGLHVPQRCCPYCGVPITRNALTCAQHVRLIGVDPNLSPTMWASRHES